MVTESLKADIMAGKVNVALSQDQIEEIRSLDFMALSEAFAPMSEQIARGATSHTPAFQGRKELSKPASKACRTIMQAARRDNVAPTERIDECKTVGVEVGDLMTELEKL